MDRRDILGRKLDCRVVGAFFFYFGMDFAGTRPKKLDRPVSFSSFIVGASSIRMRLPIFWTNLHLQKLGEMTVNNVF